eukprot:Blabericola_migrator_1__6564@NODE_3307_length_1876_cov_108_671089_g2068_i0_p1_GENE_NODE_3307_length_1876_cov_108_671089_g2068_i0NODE_3307_length_1876_cov_108_671089_g2068_i0_p1_ORF_typecomplete_len271_score31_51_NODE_3307_length_1876_cov_108_671089_g2068_i0146958
MSARHIQKPKQVNFKDGTLGTALLVTLAFDHPSEGVLQGESYVPSKSYTGPPSGSKGLPNSAKMLRPNYVPSECQQEWTSLRMNCLLQLAQASLIDIEGIPRRHKKLGELYHVSELPEGKQSYMIKSPPCYVELQNKFIPQVQRLLAKLDRETHLKWTRHDVEHKLYKIPLGVHGEAHTYFHAAQWIFGNAPPKFFKKNSEEIRKVTDLLTEWVIMFFEETTQVPREMSHRLHGISDAIINWNPERVKQFREVDKYLIDYHTLKNSKLKQ